MFRLAFMLAANAAILYFLDFLSENITITGLAALFYTAAAVAVINIIINK